MSTSDGVPPASGSESSRAGLGFGVGRRGVRHADSTRSEYDSASASASDAPHPPRQEIPVRINPPARDRACRTGAGPRAGEGLAAIGNRRTPPGRPGPDRRLPRGLPSRGRRARLGTPDPRHIHRIRRSGQSAHRRLVRPGTLGAGGRPARRGGGAVRPARRGSGGLREATHAFALPDGRTVVADDGHLAYQLFDSGGGGARALGTLSGGPRGRNTAPVLRQKCGSAGSKRGPVGRQHPRLGDLRTHLEGRLCHQENRYASRFGSSHRAPRAP